MDLLARDQRVAGQPERDERPSAAVELTGSSEVDRANWLQLLNATTSLESWQYHRYFENLSVEKVCEQWVWYVDRILAAALSGAEKPGAAAVAR